MTLAILLLALIVATCFIAYFADNLGKHLGKKRISLQIGRVNLRPRQTATLISMASSVVIMLLTLGFLLVTSDSIRNALLRYDAEKAVSNKRLKEIQKLVGNLNEQRALLEKQSDALNGQIKTNKKLAAAVVAQRQKAEVQLRQASARLGGVRNLLNNAQRARAAAANGAAAAKAGERAASRRAQEAQTRYAQTQTRFQAVQSQLGVARNQFSEAQKRLQDEKLRVDEANQRLLQVRNSLIGSREQLAAAQSNLELAQKRQREANARLIEAEARLDETKGNFDIVESQVKATFAQYNSALEEMEELKARRNKLQAELDLRSQQLMEFTDIAAKIATGDVGVRLGDVFEDATIPAGTSARQTLAKLNQLMKSGRGKLQAQDAAMTMTLTTLPVVASDGTKSTLSEDEFLRGLANYLSTLKVDASMRLIAARDHANVEKEIFVSLVPILVEVVFKKDAELAVANIDSAAGDARIFNQLLALLNGTEKRARSLRVAPLLTPENPYFYASGTNERIFEALRKIQAGGGVSHVSLVAAENITTVDSLRVRFEISKG